MTENNNILFFTQKNFNLLDYGKEVIKHWYFVTVSVIICAVISVIYTLFFLTPLYSSSAKLYVISKQTNDISSSDFSISTYLTNDFTEIITDRVILDDVVKAMDNKYSYNQIKSSITVYRPENTRIIAISVSTANAKDSKKIVDNICRVSQEKMTDILDLDRIIILREADLSTTPTTPGVIENLLLGLFAGLFLSLLVIFIAFITDNKISSSKDVEKYLNLSILATIPYNQSKLRNK